MIRDLAESDEVAALRLLDVDERRAAAAAREHGRGRAQARAADARTGLEARARADCDVLVNCASYRVNLEAMRACLAAGCHYIDLGGLYWLTGRQLELHEEFERAGLLALLGMGSSPGKTNVMAVAAVRRLQAPVERLDVMAAGRDLDPAGRALLSLRAADAGRRADAAARSSCGAGTPSEIEPLSDGGSVDFGEPIGAAPTIHTLHSELRTFPESFGCREASFRLSLAPAVLERVRELASAPPERVAAAAAEASPPSSEHRLGARGRRLQQGGAGSGCAP